MHLRSYTHTHTHKQKQVQTYTHCTHHLRAHSSLRGALRLVGVGAIFVGFCGKSVCESVWVSSSANVWEGFITRQEKTPVLSACLHILQPTESAFRVSLMAIFVEPISLALYLTRWSGSSLRILKYLALACDLTGKSKNWRPETEQTSSKNLKLKFEELFSFQSSCIRHTDKRMPKIKKGRYCTHD